MYLWTHIGVGGFTEAAPPDLGYLDAIELDAEWDVSARPVSSRSPVHAAATRVLDYIHLNHVIRGPVAGRARVADSQPPRVGQRARRNTGIVCCVRRRLEREDRASRAGCQIPEAGLYVVYLTAVPSK